MKRDDSQLFLFNSPWRVCLSDDCGRRIRNDNSIGYCAKHKSQAKSKIEKRTCLAIECDRKIQFTSAGWCYLHRSMAPAHIESGRRSRGDTTKWLGKYKTDRGCIDCGYAAHFSALQLDHTGPKSAEISEIRTCKARILDEIEAGKCVVRCANCHSVKTWAEKNGHSVPSGFCHENDGCSRRTDR